MNQTSSAKKIPDERAYHRGLIERILTACPTRRSTSPQEKKAQELIKAEFESLGLSTVQEPFRFNDQPFANLVLHFGVVLAGTAALPRWPGVALALHLLALVSYLLDSTHKAFWLRRLFPWGPSSNVLATLPAKGDVRLRIVVPAHIDSAFTGWIFHPKMIQTTTKPLLGIQFFRKQLAVAMLSICLLIAMDILLLTRVWWNVWLAWALTIPSVIALVLNAQIVLRNENVPGANDDLSGVASLPVLAMRFAQNKPDDVELVFVSTGSEEASLGGSYALACAHMQDWDPKKTIVVALDGLSGGDMQYFEEGEVIPKPMPAFLRKALHDTAETSSRFAELKPFAIPAGATDTVPFLWRGYPAVCIGCVDLSIGAPLHYHQPTDTIEHLDYEKIFLCIDFAEALIQHLIRLGTTSSEDSTKAKRA